MARRERRPSVEQPTSPRPAPGGAAPIRAMAVVLLGILPCGAALGLEPRYDHRDQKGPLVELLGVRDVHWRGATTGTADRGAVRAAWGFDPTGDGDEIFVGGTLTVLEGERTNGADRVRAGVDARYRVVVGTEELKTVFEIGIAATLVDRLSAGPLVGLGVMYDFSRSFGMFASGFFTAGAGQERLVSFGGGLGFQYRYE